MKKIIITTGSVTFAMKAKRLLESQGIPSPVIKLDSVKTENGCTHGIEIDYKNFLATVSLLKSKGIPYKVETSSDK